MYMWTPVVWPNFTGMGGLSVRRDLNMGITSWSSFRCHHGYLWTVYLCTQKNDKTQRVKRVNQGHPSSIFSFTISWCFFSPHPPDGGLDHRLSFILCSLIINKKILATRAFLTWKENLCFTSGLCLRTSTKWMSTRQTVLISVFWHHFHKTCWSSWCRCLVRHICWGWL